MWSISLYDPRFLNYIAQKRHTKAVSEFFGFGVEMRIGDLVPVPCDSGWVSREGYAGLGFWLLPHPPLLHDLGALDPGRLLPSVCLSATTVPGRKQREILVTFGFIPEGHSPDLIN